jgi:membrane protein
VAAGATQPVYERAARLSAMVVRRMGAHSAFEAAAAVAFWFFLSLVPLLVVAGFLLGLVVRSKGVDTLIGPLLDVVPPTAEPIVRKEVERLAGGAASSLAPLGIAGFLWTASSGLHNLMDVFESAVQVKHRPWWQQRGMALGWVILGLLTACLLAWLLVEIDSALRDHARHAGVRVGRALQRRVARELYTSHEQVIAAALLLVAGMTLLAGFYRFAVAHPPRVRRRIWPGTVTAVACWLIVSWVFGAYVVSIADYALYYGSLAAVAVLLVWLYLTSLSLVVGAEVNAELETPTVSADKKARPR